MAHLFVLSLLEDAGGLLDENVGAGYITQTNFSMFP